MISAIIPTLNRARDLQILLSALVPAAVDGLVRQVLAADGGSTDPTHEICEDSGVDIVAGGILAAAARAKGPWLLILPVDLRLGRGWEGALADHLAGGGGRALVRGMREATGLLAAFTAPDAGLLVQQAALAGLAETNDVKALRRRLGRGARVLS
jgi:glycosyltransferase involved in cell wall biosynthesis